MSCGPVLPLYHDAETLQVLLYEWRMLFCRMLWPWTLILLLRFVSTPQRVFPSQPGPTAECFSVLYSIQNWHLSRFLAWSIIPKYGICCLLNPEIPNKPYAFFFVVWGVSCNTFILEGVSWHTSDHWMPKNFTHGVGAQVFKKFLSRPLEHVFQCTPHFFLIQSD